MKPNTHYGIVTTNEDPAKAGRIKCAIKTVDGQEYPEWIEPVFVPGWFSPPEPGDEVELIMPEGEDLAEFAHEIKYRGQVFDESHPPPAELKQKQKKVHLRGYFTKEGHRLIFDDKEKEIWLYTVDKYQVLLSQKDKKIELTTPAKHTLVLDETNDKVSLRYKDTDVITINASGIFFGTETATEPMVLGNLWKTLTVSLVTAFLTHIHPTGVGPSGPPGGSAQSPNPTAAATTEADLVLINANTHLSDFIKGQKVKP